MSGPLAARRTAVKIVDAWQKRYHRGGTLVDDITAALLDHENNATADLQAAAAHLSADVTVLAQRIDDLERVLAKAREDLKPPTDLDQSIHANRWWLKNRQELLAEIDACLTGGQP